MFALLIIPSQPHVIFSIVMITQIAVLLFPITSDVHIPQTAQSMTPLASQVDLNLTLSIDALMRCLIGATSICGQSIHRA